jgi:hypothetical protein
VTQTQQNPGGAGRSRVSVVDWKAAHAHVRGRSHRVSGVGCQDQTGSLLNQGLAVVSLADGAGSARRAKEGADLCTRRICSLIHDHFDRFVDDNPLARRMIVEDMQKHLRRLGRELGADLSDFASTLLFVGVKNGTYLAGHLGDGVIGALAEERVVVLSPPDRGEFANMTYFITQPGVEDRLRLYTGKTGKVDGFILLSDGAAESLFNRSRQIMAPATHRILEWLDDNPALAVTRALYYNLNSIIVEKTTDDCSIAVLKMVRKTIDQLRRMDGRRLKDFLGVEDNPTAALWLDILTALAEGCSRLKDIAARTDLPVETVRRELLAMRRKNLLDRITTRPG